MKPPIEVQQLCEEYLTRVRRSTEYQLTDQDRLELYLKFGYSRILSGIGPVSLPDYTNADIALCWLALLTAKKVAFICKRGPDDYEVREIDEVREILKTAEGYLNGRIMREQAEKVLDDYWYFFRPHLTCDVYKAWATSLSILEFIVYGIQTRKEISGFDTFVLESLEAFTVIDRNLPGEWDSEEPPIPMEYNIEKRLGFWEWWLSEALPQAWEMMNEPA